MPKSSFRRSISEPFLMLVELGRWIPISALVGIMAGTASALLLVSLEYATDVRERHVWLILLLAPAGWLVAQMYKRLGASVEAGNNLIFEQTHVPSATIQLRMTPLILIGTFMTHLFGGSAGREGTAIQTGASLADQLGKTVPSGAEGASHSPHGGYQCGFRIRLWDTACGCSLRARGSGHWDHWL